MAQRGKAVSTELRVVACRAIASGKVGVNDAASLNGVCRQTLWRWMRRLEDGGEGGLIAVSRRPHSFREVIPVATEKEVLRLRVKKGWGPERIAARVRSVTGRRISGSTVHRILREHGLNRQDVPRKVYPRWEMTHPGELFHLDEKELVSLRTGSGPEHLFAALDAFSREAFLMVFKRANGDASEEFLEYLLSAVPYSIESVMTDNALIFTMRRSAHPERECGFQRTLRVEGIRHLLTKPYTPRTNGKVERFFGTLERELLRVRRFRDARHRREEIERFGDYYNTERPHSAIGYATPTLYRVEYFIKSPDVANVSE